MVSNRRGIGIPKDDSRGKRPRDHQLTISEDCSDERQVLKRRLLAPKGRRACIKWANVSLQSHTPSVASGRYTCALP